FRDHSFDHDFWWSYAIPYAVLAVVIVLRDATARMPVRARAAVAAVAVAALSAVGIVASRARHLEMRTDELRDRGHEFHRFAGKNDALLFVADFDLASFYLDAWFPPVGTALGGLDA